MKKVISVIAAFTLIACLLTSCNLFAKSNYVKGTFDEDGYKSEFLNLQFYVPDDFKMLSQKELDSYNEDIAEDADTITYEMGCESEEGVSAFVVCEQVSGLVSLDMYIENFIEGYQEEGDDLESEIGEVKSKKFADETWKMLSIKSNYNGVDVLQDFYFKKVENTVVTVMISYYDGFSTRSLVNSFESIE